MNIWMSSAVGSISILPLSKSDRILVSSVTIDWLSAADIMPVSPSIVAWAMLPFMSWRYILLSKEIEELKAFTVASTSLVNLPAHIFSDIGGSLSLV